jgi:hypothetical protein
LAADREKMKSVIRRVSQRGESECKVEDSGLPGCDAVSVGE